MHDYNNHDEHVVPIYRMICCFLVFAAVHVYILICQYSLLVQYYVECKKQYQ
jgi:hypothetical protein